MQPENWVTATGEIELSFCTDSKGDGIELFWAIPDIDERNAHRKKFVKFQSFPSSFVKVQVTENVGLALFEYV